VENRRRGRRLDGGREAWTEDEKRAVVRRDPPPSDSRLLRCGSRRNPARQVGARKRRTMGDRLPPCSHPRYRWSAACPRAGRLQHAVRPRTRPYRDERREFSPPHSITSPARARIAGGMVRPRTLAVLRLTASSYFVGAWTGRSAAFSPLRTRST